MKKLTLQEKVDKAKQEKLLERLDEMTGRRYMDFPWSIRDRQAYDQLRRIVGEYFRRKDFTKGYEIKQIQQKPTVTREHVRSFASDLERQLDNLIPNSDAVCYTEVLVYFLGWMLGRCGVEVVDE